MEDRDDHLGTMQNNYSIPSWKRGIGTRNLASWALLNDLRRSSLTWEPIITYDPHWERPDSQCHACTLYHAATCLPAPREPWSEVVGRRRVQHLVSLRARGTGIAHDVH